MSLALLLLLLPLLPGMATWLAQLLHWRLLVRVAAAALMLIACTRCAAGCSLLWYVARCVREASEQRMKRRVQRYRLSSDINALQRELRQLRAQLEHEQREQKRVSQQLRRLQHAKQVQSVPSQLFHLSAVKLYHNEVVQASPVSVSAR